MKAYIKWIIVAVALIGVIGGASIMYNKLGNMDFSYDSSSESEFQTTLDSTESVTEDMVTDKQTNNGTEAPDTQGVETKAPETEAITTEKVEEIVNNMNEANNFTVTDVDGNQVEIKSLVGKPIVMNIWATWCTWCDREMPDFDAMYQKYGNEVNFMMVNATKSDLFETVAKAKKYVSERGFTFPVYFDTTGEAMVKYATQGYPCTFFFDETGVLVDYHIGYMDGATLEEYIKKIK